jgi:hypothetical protein
MCIDKRPIERKAENLGNEGMDAVDQGQLAIGHDAF